VRPKKGAPKPARGPEFAKGNENKCLVKEAPRCRLERNARKLAAGLATLGVRSEKVCWGVWGLVVNKGPKGKRMSYSEDRRDFIRKGAEMRKKL